MPLRDHFRPPVDLKSSWEGFHGQWPGSIVRELRKLLPEGFIAEPRVHLGREVEIDVATYETDEALLSRDPEQGEGGVATAVWAPPSFSVALEDPIPDYDAYEVRIYDMKRGRQLVAAIEIVSPGNKDRPEARNAFVAKCAGYLQNRVAVSIIDLVTVRHFNLYQELMTFLGQVDPALPDPAPTIYAAACRWQPNGKRVTMKCWTHTLNVGDPLPTLPLWLREGLVIPIVLESSYEEACHDVWIT